jgi:hypothetical protein
LKLTNCTDTIHFRKLKVSKEDTVRYFKDEKWGTRDIFASGDRVRKRQPSLRTILRLAKKAIDKAEGSGAPGKHVNFALKVVQEMSTGPDWAKEVESTLEQFVKDELLGSLKKLVPILKEKANRAPNPVGSK